MISMTKIRVLLPLCAGLFLLAGCGEYYEQKDDLQVYVTAIKARQNIEIEPLPKVKSYEPFTYSAVELRDPFIKSIVQHGGDVGQENTASDNGIHPDEYRQKEVLEEYSLSELLLVGTMEQEGNIWGIIRSSDGVVHRVQAGNYMGENSGKILTITDNELTLKEIVPDGKFAHVERESSLHISDIE